MWDRGYYYQHKRIDGKPRRVYVGGGLLGELAAQEQAQRAAQDAQRRLQRAQDAAADKAIDAQYKSLRAAAWALLQAAGYYQHKREWRRMDMKKLVQRYAEAAIMPPEDKRGATAKGGAGKLKTGADTEPPGRDLTGARALSGLMVAEQMAASYCKGQPEAQAVVKMELRTLCRDLGLDDAPPIERELIAHVAECWLWLKLAQLTLNRISSAEHSFREGEYRERRVSEAQRRYLRAVNLLTKLRNLQPGVQVNVANQQVVMNGGNGGPG